MFPRWSPISQWSISQYVNCTDTAMICGDIAAYCRCSPHFFPQRNELPNLTTMQTLLLVNHRLTTHLVTLHLSILWIGYITIKDNKRYRDWTVERVKCPVILLVVEELVIGTGIQNLEVIFFFKIWHGAWSPWDFQKYKLLAPQNPKWPTPDNKCTIPRLLLMVSASKIIFIRYFEHRV